MRIALALAVLLAVPASARPPKLTVVIAVDQMRADYLDRFGSELSGGLARMVRDGALFTRARHAHVPTETAPGHAALMTGCFPSQHGIVGNDWWDKSKGRMVLAVEDGDKQRGPGNLGCPTLGEALKAARPAARVVSISGKDRAAILMGGRKTDLVLWYDKKSGRFVTGSRYGRLPGWVGTWNDALGIPPEERATVALTARYDAMTLELGMKAVDELKLGGRGETDLLAVSLSATDFIGHTYGPDDPRLKAHILSLDALLGSFFEGLDRKLGAGAWTAALSADHGVTPLPETSPDPAAVRVSSDGLARDLEAELRARLGAPPAGSGRWLLGLSSPHVWLDPKAVVTAERWLWRQPAVAHVYTDAELAGAAEGPYAEEFRRSRRPGRSGDLMVVFKRGATMDYGNGSGGAVHGLPSGDDANVPLILMGAGVVRGRFDAPVLATDLAPTLAILLEAKLEAKAPGRTLVEALAR